MCIQVWVTTQSPYHTQTLASPLCSVFAKQSPQTTIKTCQNRRPSIFLSKQQTQQTQHSFHQQTGGETQSTVLCLCQRARVSLFVSRISCIGVENQHNHFIFNIRILRISQGNLWVKKKNLRFRFGSIVFVRFYKVVIISQQG